MSTKRAKYETTVVVGDEQFPVDRDTLIAKSPVFRAMFETEMQESITNKITVSGCSINAVKTFFQCLASPFLLDTDVLLLHGPEILVLSDKYQVLSFVQKAEKYVSESVTVDNCIHLLQLAELHSFVDLKDATFKVISENVSLLSKSANLVEILGSDLINELLVHMSAVVKSKSLVNGQFEQVLRTKVIVSGAGYAEVNGEYFARCLDGDSRESLFFYKQTTYENKTAYIVIDQCESPKFDFKYLWHVRLYKLDDNFARLKNGESTDSTVYYYKTSHYEDRNITDQDQKFLPILINSDEWNVWDNENKNLYLPTPSVLCYRS